MPRATVTNAKKPRARPKKRTANARTSAIDDTLRQLDERLEAMEARLEALERRTLPSVVPDVGPPCCSDDVIGCLDDCDVDVKNLRKKVKDVRSTTRRH